uniref:Uncharacterized protein n=1 Tax=Trichuris muris TaxID=70415 RepID=A0A5S6Q5D0_TRIMR
MWAFTANIWLCCIKICVKDVGETETHLQEEFIELQTNEEVKTRYKNGYHDFWLQREISIRYPQLWEIRRIGPFDKEKKPAGNSPTRRLKTAAN